MLKALSKDLVISIANMLRFRVLIVRITTPGLELPVPSLGGGNGIASSES